MHHRPPAVVLHYDSECRGGKACRLGQITNAGRGLDGRKDRWVSAARCKHRKARLQVGWHQGPGGCHQRDETALQCLCVLGIMNRVRMAWAPARPLQRNNFTLGPGFCIVRSPLSPSDNRSEQTSFSDSTFVNLSSTSWVPAILAACLSQDGCDTLSTTGIYPKHTAPLDVPEAH